MVRGLAGMVAAGALVGLGSPAQAQVAPGGKERVSAVGEKLRQVLNGLRLQDVLDTAPPGGLTGSPQKIVQQPQVDATIMELDRRGRPVSSGTVLMSPLYPTGVVVPVDRSFFTTAVRWRQWDDAGWYANKGQGTIDVVPGRENARIDHMLDYPASVMKLMVSFGVLRLVDQGQLTLDTTYDYRPDPVSPLCGGATSKTIRQYVDESLTWSSNAASCALIKLLNDRNAIDPLNQTFQDLGLQTLQLKGTRPANGGLWTNSITMSSLDTAKLLALVNGAPGRVWTTPGGKPVTSAVLSAQSRRFFLDELGQQGFNDMLSSADWCGGAYPGPGLPNAVPARWIGADGTVTVDGNKFGRDVRPCNAKAEVSFAHKTGWVNNGAGDAGIVKALPGKGGRSYIIVVFSNLGTQYVDAERPATPTGIYPYTYTQKFAQLGRLMDTYEKRRARKA